MTDLTRLSIAEAHAGLAAKDFSATELTRAYLDAMEKGRALNAYVLETPAQALAMAAASDARIAKGEIGPLEGIPLGIKDLFCTKGTRTTACSNILANFVPTYESTVTQNLWRDGAVMLGKLNNDEFAMGSSNETSCFPGAINPWRRQGSNVSAGAGGVEGSYLVPGGSSGGSSSAVAAFLCAGATATDTGGSIRQPASFSGITGIKPTYGRVSRYGMIAFASSLDQGGPMARTAEDCAMLLNAMAGFDPKDSTSLTPELGGVEEDFTRLLGQPRAGATADKPLAGLRIGLPREYFGAGLSADVEKAVRAALAEYEKLGATLVDVTLPKTELSIPVYYVIAPAEASSNLSRFDGVRYGHRAAEYRDLLDMYKKTRAEGFGPEVKRRIMVGTYVLSHGYYDAYYLQAQKIRRIIADDFQRAFGQCDVIMGPVAPSVAWKLGEKTADPVQMYLADIFTLSTSLAGLPGMSVPCGFGDGNMPVGLQLIGNYFDEARLLQVAHAFQQATDWHLRRPA